MFTNEDNCDDERHSLISYSSKAGANTGPKIISLEEIPKYLNVFISVYPFIYTGYRIHHSLLNCFKSIFRLHNETFNIWTHLIPFIATIVILAMRMKTVHVGYSYIIDVYIITSMLLFMFSFLYHTFSCHSNDICQCFYKLDLSGIILQLMSASLCSFNFMFHEFEEIKKAYLFIFCGLGLFAIILTSLDYFVSAKLNNFLMVFYATLFLVCFMSSIHWASIARIEEILQMSKFVIMGFMFIVIGFIIFFSKFPECVIKHRIIDHYFNSHILWHLCCVGCVLSYYLLFCNYNIIISNKQII
jgi:adiponectin receptor